MTYGPRRVPRPPDDEDRESVFAAVTAAVKSETCLMCAEGFCHACWGQWFDFFGPGTMVCNCSCRMQTAAAPAGSFVAEVTALQDALIEVGEVIIEGFVLPAIQWVEKRMNRS